MLHFVKVLNYTIIIRMRMKTFITQHLVGVTVAAAAVLSGAFAIWYVATSRVPSFAGLAPVHGNVIAALDESGTVRADNNAALSFQEGGEIAHVYAAEGRAVAAGTVLADLEQGSLEANVEQATATLASAKAKLDGLQAGTRPQEIAIDQAAVASAQSTLAADIVTAYAAADDAVRNQTDNLFMNSRTINPLFNVPVNDSQLANSIPSARVQIEGTLTQWYAAMNPSNVVTTTALAGIASSALTEIQSYLNMLALAVNNALTNASLSAATLASYKADVVTSRTEVDGAVSTLVGVNAALTAAENTLILAQAGATPQDIEAQQASVAQAQAALAAAQVALANATLAAPFSGTVENVTAQVGQVVAPGTPLMTLVNNGGLKVQTYVSEADVAKISVGQSAQITLDAFGTGEIFPATVTAVDDTQTQANGAPAYLVTLYFSQPESQVKDGMTGNVRIILAEHDNVLEVPSRLVINDNNQYYLLVQAPGGAVRKQVTIGLAGDDGMTEIASGLTGDEELANF